MDCKRAAPSGVARPLQYVRSGLRADLPMSEHPHVTQRRHVLSEGW